MVHIEIVISRATSESILAFLRMKVLLEHAVTACVENVDVVRRDHFSVSLNERQTVKPR